MSQALAHGEAMPADSLCRSLLWGNATAVVLLVGEEGRILASSRAAQLAYGYSEAEFLGLSLSSLSCEPIDACMDMQLTATISGIAYETKHRRKDGTCFPVQVSSATGKVAEETVALHFIVDTTPRKRLESTQDLLRQVDTRILQRQPLTDTLQFLCDRAAELLCLDLVWIGLKAEHGAMTTLVAGGPGTAFVPNIGLRWDEDINGSGPAGTLSMPLNVDGKTLGALSFYSSTANAFDKSTRDMLMSFADRVALSLQAARQQDEIALQRVTLEAAANAVVITDPNGQILWVNPAFTNLTGYTMQDIAGLTPRVLKSGRHTEQFYKQLWDRIRSGEGPWHGELFNRRKDGTVYIDEQTITPVHNGQGELTHFICIKQDVTERRQREDQLRHLATHDPVTGVLNRRALSDHLQRLINRAVAGTGAALLLLDLDRFKLVNDTMGHAAGDQLLIGLTQLCRRFLRPSDVLARLGGDEFAILLDGVTVEQAQGVAERIRKGIADFRFEHQGKLLSVGASVGVVAIDGSLDADSVTALADSALYDAKEDGGDRTVVFGTGMNGGQELFEAAHWAGRIRDAITNGLFFLEMQPVADLRTRQREHCEVLLRLRGEDGQTILPGEFIPAAEQFGLMPQVDRWVVDQTLRLLQDTSSLSLFMNISGQSLGDEDFLVSIEKRLRDQPQIAARLTFEITETAAVRDLLGAEAWMWRLKELGCRFALDDFGAGFSSFMYLRSLPVDYVKVDGSLVRNMDSEPTDRALVQAVVTVAHALGKSVIAEWVETREVAEALIALGVHTGQGYFLFRPQSVLHYTA
ncbi:MAG TPA: EAL domain-containing protein [Symbiobacteriaceae bacterium]|nr:EAL domain-containing protein [Symbiobacteriaceae bacterium]